jgi:hypothetical protein
VPRPK